ncbi:MAG: hypothetical protein KDJ38_10920 [Gammaproteobacteria bacterium]|nr:hypothetical protein [Gammaproteobacteria bacterium]
MFLILGVLACLHLLMGCKLKLWSFNTSVAVTFALVVTPIAILQSF